MWINALSFFHTNIHMGDGDDMIDILGKCVTGLNLRLIVIIFVLFILVNTETFDKYVLSKFSCAVELGKPTTWGYIVKGIMFVMLYLVFDGLIHHGVL